MQPDTHGTAPEAVTVVWSRRAKPGRQAALENVIDRLAQAMSSATGYEGVVSLRPQPGHPPIYTMVARFASQSDLDAWVSSEIRGRLYAEAEGVSVGGLNVQQAEIIVQERLSAGGYFTDPQVSIFEKEYATQGISVLGEVQKPGIYPLLGTRALFDAISAAGGFTPKAGNTITITHRSNPKEAQTVVLPPNQTFPAESNLAVFPGDTVVVSKAGIVYVVGDVRMPGGFVMENSRLTVLQAIAMAQGTNTTAKLDKTALIRKGLGGQQQIPIPLLRIMSAKAPDITLQPDDIVFVPRSEGKAAVRRSLEAILQAATGAAIYRPY